MWGSAYSDDVTAIGDIVERGLIDLSRHVIDDPEDFNVWMPENGDHHEYLEPFNPIEDLHGFRGNGAWGQVIDKALEDMGTEVLGYYKSFRWMRVGPHPGSWGIFFNKPAIAELTSNIANSTGAAFPAVQDHVIRFVKTHELFHYKVDATCLSIETKTKKCLYRRYLNTLSSQPMTNWFEEAVANNYALKSVSSGWSSVFDALVDMVLRSPGAYAMGVSGNLSPDLRGYPSPAQIQGELAQQIVQELDITEPSGEQEVFLRECMVRQLKMTITKNDRVKDAQLGKPFSPLNRTCPEYWVDFN